MPVLLLPELLYFPEKLPVLFLFSDNEYVSVKEITDAGDYSGTALFQFFQRVYWKVKKKAFAFNALVSKQNDYKENKKGKDDNFFFSIPCYPLN